MQLTDEEHVYLTAAAQGDVPIIRQSLEDDPDPSLNIDCVNDDPRRSLNINCVDYMGRSALHLAVDSESVETVELLLEKLSFDCIEESLRYAISKGNTKIVRTIVEHPSYIAGGADQERARRRQRDPFFRTDEKSQFSPARRPRRRVCR